MIPFVKAIEFEYGAVQQVSPLVRRIIARNPGPFTFTGTGTYIVGRGEGVAVIDPGPDLAAHLQAILDAVAHERVSHILVTHHHLDHSPLAKPLAAATGAVVYGCAVSETPPEGPEGDVKLEAGYDRFLPDVSVCAGAVIPGHGWTLEAIPTPGHTSNHICYGLAEENACFTGDHIMGWSTTVVTPPDGNMGDYLASLDLIRARDFATLWPTHGPPVTEVGPFLDAYKAHRLDREQQILQRLAAGDRRIGEMVPHMYAGVDPRLHAAGAHSVLAHVIELVRSGRVATEGAPGLGNDYRPA
ncbi:MAG: MBL fold metallo-hydrolase [Caulobacteraceae bacterium]|nr:MBL fold metallo-hydrolase [Caulobacteraceae bacterium]